MRDFKSIGAEVVGSGFYIDKAGMFWFPAESSDKQIFRALCGYLDKTPGFDPVTRTFIWYDVVANYSPEKHYTTFYNHKGSVEVTNPQKGCLWDFDWLNNELRSLHDNLIL